MTAVNTALLLAKSNISFAIGTIAGQVAAAVAADRGTVGMGVAIVFNLVIIGFFVGTGLLAKRGHRWAFVVALIGYACDALLLFFAPDLISIAFHAWALFSLGMGWVALGQLRTALAAEAAAAVERATPVAPAPEPPPITP